MFFKECESQGGVANTGDGWYSCHINNYQITRGANEPYDAGKLTEVAREVLDGVGEALRSLGLDANGAHILV